MSLDADKINYIASQIALRPDQRRALHEHLKPYIKSPAPSAVQAAASRRLARLDAAMDANTAEFSNLSKELKRLGISWNRESGVDLKEVRATADRYRWSPEQKIRLIAQCERCGLAD